MTDFRVVPRALRRRSDAIVECSNRYGTAVGLIASKSMGDKVLGRFGEGIPAIFNEAARSVVEALGKSGEAVHSAGVGIGECANIYERMDAEFYRRFGYLAEK
ncbi:hypothetical protein [Nocardia arthritidis]|uniref:ESX-1 secretion-associated protein n=1 Tax=Nocardia arthritidis TaxID=228602 RepID=A0A6G9YD46_9NOCA|nr:hypothetical protein [Nocardia arthritidis]QIS11149.1 hypothetical protein F5544_16350 [Nocardia arthritidis]